ncbi:MAG TPA: segregation/condensation protein A [Vampirovibrionales bacterium]
MNTSQIAVEEKESTHQITNSPTEEILKPENTNILDSAPEILVEMAKKNEIDPWDVDLKLVIDKFLTHLNNKDEKQELKEAARIIFFVSVLLRIKSQKIYTRPDPAEEVDEFGDDLIDFENIDFEELDENKDPSKLLSTNALDHALTRNTRAMKQKRGRGVTLEELVKLFEEAEHKVSKRKFKKKTTLEDFDDEDGIVLREDEDTDILDLAHDENLEQKIEILSKYILETLSLQTKTALSEIKDAVGDNVDTFLSALFLTHSGKTEIEQIKFYEEIWLKRIV